MMFSKKGRNVGVLMAMVVMEAWEGVDCWVCCIPQCCVDEINSWSCCKNKTTQGGGSENGQGCLCSSQSSGGKGLSRKEKQAFKLLNRYFKQIIKETNDYKDHADLLRAIKQGEIKYVEIKKGSNNKNLKISVTAECKVSEKNWFSVETIKAVLIKFRFEQLRRSVLMSGNQQKCCKCCHVTTWSEWCKSCFQWCSLSCSSADKDLIEQKKNALKRFSDDSKGWKKLLKLQSRIWQLEEDLKITTRYHGGVRGFDILRKDGSRFQMQFVLFDAVKQFLEHLQANGGDTNKYYNPSPAISELQNMRGRYKKTRQDTNLESTLNELAYWHIVDRRLYTDIGETWESKDEQAKKMLKGAREKLQYFFRQPIEENLDDSIDEEKKKQVEKEKKK